MDVLKQTHPLTGVKRMLTLPAAMVAPREHITDVFEVNEQARAEFHTWLASLDLPDLETEPEVVDGMDICECGYVYDYSIHGRCPVCGSEVVQGKEMLTVDDWGRPDDEDVQLFPGPEATPPMTKSKSELLAELNETPTDAVEQFIDDFLPGSEKLEGEGPDDDGCYTLVDDYPDLDDGLPVEVDDEDLATFEFEEDDEIELFDEPTDAELDAEETGDIEEEEFDADVFEGTDADVLALDSDVELEDEANEPEFND
jgi:hypothetical protein